jgi:hypothetical protein
MEISRLERTVTIVARGRIEAEELLGVAQRLADAKVRSFAKIVEVAGATTNFPVEQVVRLAEFMRGSSTEKRGPVAFVINPEHQVFPKAFASETEGDGPISLFTSLRAARDWIQRSKFFDIHAQPPTATESDPARLGVMIRGARQREVPIRPTASA